MSVGQMEQHLRVQVAQKLIVFLKKTKYSKIPLQFLWIFTYKQKESILTVNIRHFHKHVQSQGEWSWVAGDFQLPWNISGIHVPSIIDICEVRFLHRDLKILKESLPSGCETPPLNLCTPPQIIGPVIYLFIVCYACVRHKDTTACMCTTLCCRINK